MKTILKKAEEIVEQIPVAMITTIHSHGGLCSRPMYVQKMDEDGRLWLFANANSEFVKEIRANAKLNMTFSDAGKGKFMSAVGVATEDFDREKMKQLWTSRLESWFPEGVDTPDIVLIKVTADNVEVWEEPGMPMIQGLVQAFMRAPSREPARHEKVDLRH